jgi:hypothetical protein
MSVPGRATPASEQQHISAGRAIRLKIDEHQSSPDEPLAGDLTQPDLTTSPLRADGQAPAMGFMFMFKQPQETAAPVNFTPAVATVPATGFTVNVWVRNPTTGRWGSSAQFSVPYDAWFSTFDTNGGDLYWQIAFASVASGNYIDVEVVEL